MQQGILQPADRQYTSTRLPLKKVRELMPGFRRESVLWRMCCACQCQWTPVVDFKNQITSVSCKSKNERYKMFRNFL